MMKSSMHQNFMLRSSQLNQLERLLAMFQEYKKKHESTFLYALDALCLIGNCSSIDALQDVLSCQKEGLSINTLFGMDRTMQLDNKSGFALGTVMQIYADMKIPFHEKTFSFSNLFFHALKQMQNNDLSSDALTRIIRLIQGRQDGAYAMYVTAQEAMPSFVDVSSVKNVVTHESPLSYQRAVAVAKPSRRVGMFDHQNDSGVGKAWVAEQEGYTSIPDATMK
jgi:hypothetical protein